MSTSREKTESQYTVLLSKALETAGCMVESIVGSRMNRAGRPDRYISNIYWHGWLEAKKYHEPLSGPQKTWHEDALRRQPLSVYIIRYFPTNNSACLCYWYFAENKEIVIEQYPLGMLSPKYPNNEYLHKLIRTMACGRPS